VQTLILGLVQGLAEWLPISSTAHLRIVEHFFGLAATPLFNVVLHAGTLVVVVLYFRKDVIDILSALAHMDFRSGRGHLIPLIVVATVPTAIIGLLYVAFLEDVLQTMLAIGVTLLIGATVVYVSKNGSEKTDVITYKTALAMGVAQGLAVFPGLSRSGVTVSTALLLGLKREEAFRFSFLLSIPAILGDLIVETYKQRGQLAIQNVGSVELLAGVIVAMVVGYLAIGFVSRIVESRRLHYFAFYTWLLGIAVIALTLSGF